MGLEQAGFIHELVVENPVGSDFVQQGGGLPGRHINMIKAVLQGQFPDIKTKGIINAIGDETLPDPDERLWSPDALLAWLIANWSSFSQTPTQTALAMRAWNSADGTPRQIVIPSGAYKFPMDIAASFTGGTYDETNYRWIPGEIGTYLVHGKYSADPSSGDEVGGWSAQIRYFDGNTSSVVADYDFEYKGDGKTHSVPVSDIVEITDVAHGLEFWANNDERVEGFITNKWATYFCAHKISSVVSPVPAAV